ncbi:MAG: hypothetical protein QF615_01010 [Planctomycetota bacterium]|jgi:hypothetical protein|nr:hypothetical protein [Planctomycetota bacterium]MDP6368157.1 hypothetical protein [Planctomycetota bacterium]
MLSNCFELSFIRTLAPTCSIVIFLAQGVPIAGAQDASLDFDGVSGYGICNDAAPIQGSTWESWIRVGELDPSATTSGWVVGWWGWWTATPYRVTGAGELFGPGGYGSPDSDVVLANLAPDSWHHLAATFGGECSPGVNVYLDGQLAWSYGEGEYCPSSWYTVLAAYNYLGWHGFYKGQIDEVRISNTVRYTGAFTPSQRHVVDADTWALWHFDEGSGAQAVDEVAGHVFELNGGFSWSLGIGSDCNGNGIPDDQDISTGASADCDGNGVPDECDVAADPSLDANDNGVLDSCECLVSSYCKSEPNSSGNASLLTHGGSVSVMHNDLSLQANGCPPQEKGVFFYGGAPASLPFGSGTLCVTAGDAAYFRFAPVVTDNEGSALQVLDLSAPTQLSGTITPNSTWYFQFWYTDTCPGRPSGFNFSDALEIQFCQ